MKHKGTTLSVKFAKYNNGQNAILLQDIQDGQPYAVASVALELPLLQDEVAIKDYSENEGILNELLHAGIVDPPHRMVSSGFVTIPICKMKRV